MSQLDTGARGDVRRQTAFENPVPVPVAMARRHCSFWDRKRATTGGFGGALDSWIVKREQL